VKKIAGRGWADAVMPVHKIHNIHEAYRSCPALEIDPNTMVARQSPFASFMQPMGTRSVLGDALAL
jgi:hypothetical protein